MYGRTGVWEQELPSKKQWASHGIAYKKVERDDGLLPCPWCGRVPRVHMYTVAKTKERRFGVWCDNGREHECPMLALETLPFKTRQEAIDAWNKRS